jgi:transcriptional activator SPT7
MQRSLIQLLSHAGFEGANTNSLNVLTDMMTDYIGNLGKTLRHYFDDYGKEMDGEVKGDDFFFFKKKRK